MMMRALVVGLGLLLAVPVWAEGDQAEDDERPGARQGKGEKRPALTNDDVVEPERRDAEERPPAPTSDDGAPERKTKSIQREGKRTGDSPINLVGPAHAEGSYAGVSLGGEGLPPHPPKLPLKGPQRMTWPGFQVKDGVPTVFLQTTGVPNYQVADTKGGVQVTLRGTKIQLRNNRRPLKVAEFGTHVTEISAKPHGKDVVVTIKTKGASSHRERVEQSAGGFQLLVVELPSGK